MFVPTVAISTSMKNYIAPWGEISKVVRTLGREGEPWQLTRILLGKLVENCRRKHGEVKFTAQ